MPTIQRRAFCLNPELRVSRASSDAPPTIVGYAAVFNTITDLGYCTESIAPGAFKESIDDGDDVAALINHDPSLILGRVPKTLTLKEDDHGLYVEIIPPNTSAGRDIVESLARGDVSQMSFGFYPDPDGEVYTPISATTKAHFTITNCELFDVSIVTYPAYPNTEAGLARMAQDRESEMRERMSRYAPKEDVEAAIRACKEHRDRTISLMKLAS